MYLLSLSGIALSSSLSLFCCIPSHSSVLLLSLRSESPTSSIRIPPLSSLRLKSRRHFPGILQNTILSYVQSANRQESYNIHIRNKSIYRQYHNDELSPPSPTKIMRFDQASMSDLNGDAKVIRILCPEGCASEANANDSLNNAFT